jgi:hypothetical protein
MKINRVQPTAFTIGNKASYDRSLEDPNCIKIGIRPSSIDPKAEPYPGGCAWQTREEAEAYLDGFPGREIDFGNGPVVCSVYGLLLPNGWDIDVGELNEAEGFHHLRTDSRFVSVG